MVKYNREQADIKGIEIKEEKISIIDGNEISVRYKLEIPLNNWENENELLVIMMNPSKANKEESDRTVNKVVQYASQNRYRKLIIMNSLPFYETKSEKLNAVIRQIVDGEAERALEHNFSEIQEAISNLTRDILLATGNPKIKTTRIWMDKIYDLLDGKTGRIYKKNKTGYYSHPLYNSRTERVTFEKP